MDINDLTIVLANYNKSGMTWSKGDFTGDGKVDINDLTIVLAHYNQTAGTAPPPCRSRRSVYLLSVGPSAFSPASLATMGEDGLGIT